MSEQTVKEREEFAMATERKVRLEKLNLCSSGLQDTATNDSLLVKLRDASSTIYESLSQLDPTVRSLSILLVTGNRRSRVEVRKLNMKILYIKHNNIFSLIQCEDSNIFTRCRKKYSLHIRNSRCSCNSDVHGVMIV